MCPLLAVLVDPDLLLFLAVRRRIEILDPIFVFALDEDPLLLAGRIVGHGEGGPAEERCEREDE